jgi:hypothetical protein
MTTTRRTFFGAALGSAAVSAFAQTVSPKPTPRDWTGQTPVQYPEPDVVALDNRFRRYIVGNTASALTKTYPLLLG